MAREFTRRELAAFATAAALSAQAPSPPVAPVPANPNEELSAARALIRKNIDQLSQFPLPMTTEPACHFKAE